MNKGKLIWKKTPGKAMDERKRVFLYGNLFRVRGKEVYHGADHRGRNCV